MSAPAPAGESLVSGGNVQGGQVTVANARLSPQQQRMFGLWHFCQMWGIMVLAAMLLWISISTGYSTWRNHITSTPTMFKATLTGVPVFHFNLGFWIAFTSIGLVCVFAGILGKDAILKSSLEDRGVLVMMVLMLITGMMIAAVGSSALLGLIFKWGDKPDEQGIRTAGNAWIAQHINLKVNTFNVAFKQGVDYDPVFLRSLKPDGTLDEVYKIVSDGQTLSITPE